MCCIAIIQACSEVNFDFLVVVLPSTALLDRQRLSCSTTSTQSGQSVLNSAKLTKDDVEGLDGRVLARLVFALLEGTKFRTLEFGSLDSCHSFKNK
jgi:hypothetical protein